MLLLSDEFFLPAMLAVAEVGEPKSSSASLVFRVDRYASGEYVKSQEYPTNEVHDNGVRRAV